MAPTGVDHVERIVDEARGLGTRTVAVIDGLCDLTESGDRIDPAASPDGVGSGDPGFCIGLDMDWPEPQPRPLAGRSRRTRPAEAEGPGAD